MKRILPFFIFIFLYSTFAQANLESPFKSTVKNISIKNTHRVGKLNKIFRGMSPLGKVNELKNFEITDIIIFKNQTRDEIDQELAEIDGIFKPNIYQFDFLWHDFKSYQVACEQVLSAFKIMKEVLKSQNRKLFFHCTVGEDRTGALAGLWRMISQNWSQKNAFKYEMCERGYEHGNGNKPKYVVNEIREDLTPLFLYLSNLIKSKKLTLDNIDFSVCTDKLPQYKKIPKCKISSKFVKKSI